VNGKLAALVRATGLVSAANILARRKLGFARPIFVHPRREKTQVWLRPCDSDLFVVSQIFGTREYDLGTEHHEPLKSRFDFLAGRGYKAPDHRRWRECGILIHLLFFDVPHR